MIQYRSSADPVVPPLDSINCYLRVVEDQTARMRSRTGAEPDRTQAELEMGRFYRLLMVPGMAHCKGGAGADHLDTQNALEKWVDHDEVLRNITATKTANNYSSANAVFSRSLCVYPGHAYYDRSGNPNDAGSFECQSDDEIRETPVPAPECLR